VITRAICHLYSLELPGMQDKPPSMTDNGSEDITTDVNGQEQSVTKCDKENRKSSSGCSTMNPKMSEG